MRKKRDLPDPSCSRGIPNGFYCCKKKCGRCGGRGCRGLPGGADCCKFGIEKMSRDCGTVGPPCSTASKYDFLEVASRRSQWRVTVRQQVMSTTPNSSSAPIQLLDGPDPNCSNGIPDRRFCCPRQCGRCGGKRCKKLPGGLFCCRFGIKKLNRDCDFVGAPCEADRRFVVPSVATSPSASASASAIPVILDEACIDNLRNGNICCPKQCGQCGGPKCGRRPPVGGACCPRRWKESGRFCTQTEPPCIIVPSASPTASPSPSPLPSVTGDGKWKTVRGLSGRPRKRHEACMAWVGGKGYLIGGRRIQPVSIFDPKAKTWTTGTSPGFEMHHMQCVTYDEKIWVISSWTGGFPREQNVEDIWIYDPMTDLWDTRDGLPEDRRRGGGGVVLWNDQMWVVAGNRGGHGAHATTLGWLDMYDPVRDEWTMGYSDVPVGRDHIQAAIVHGRLCVAGGRDGGVGNFFQATIGSTYCYDFLNDEWTREMDLPGPRAGIMVTELCSGEMMVAGGEKDDAFDSVDLFDGTSWRRTAGMKQKRHSGGLATTDCACGKVFVASGNGARGGGFELESTEVWDANGDVTGECDKY